MKTPGRPNPHLARVLAKRDAGLLNQPTHDLEKSLDKKSRKKTTPRAHQEIFNKPHPKFTIRSRGY